MATAPWLKVLGVLAGEEMPVSQLRRWADSAEFVLAADGGADRLLAAEARCDVVVGDLDSASPRALAGNAEVVRLVEQTSTDCDKLLALAAQRGFERVTLASVEGSLPDHVAATLQSAAKSPLSVRLAFRRGLGYLVKPGEALRLAGRQGARLSLIPISECSGVELLGVRWPLSEARLSPLGLASVSNVVEAESAQASLASGAAFLFVETSGDPEWD